MLLYLLPLEFWLSMVFFSDPLLKVEGLLDSLRECFGLKFESEAWSTRKNEIRKRRQLTRAPSLIAVRRPMKIRRATRLLLFDWVAILWIKIIARILMAYFAARFHWNFTSPSLKVTDLCSLLILALVYATFGRRVETSLSAILAMFVRAVNSGFYLEILLYNLFSLYWKASGLFKVLLHALSFEIDKVPQSNSFNI